MKIIREFYRELDPHERKDLLQCGVAWISLIIVLFMMFVIGG